MRVSTATAGACAALLAMTASPAGAQRLLESDDPSWKTVRIVGEDMAVLTHRDERRDLPCIVEGLEPRLDYDLNFRAGYNVRLPLKPLAGDGDELRMLFRIRPLEGDQEPTYFRDGYKVPAIEEDATGEATLIGRYRLGPGRYEIDWLMRDRRGRVCSAHWETAATMVEGLEDLAASPTANTVRPHTDSVFFEEPPTRRSPEPLRVKILVNFTPVDSAKASLGAYDLRSIISMLRAVVRAREFGLFTLVAFNMQEERIVYEEVEATRIDFPALGEAVESIRGGMIDFEKLQDKQSGRRFVEEFFRRHLGRSESDPDLVIVLGPKLVLEKNPSRPFVARSERVAAPIFYVIYNRNPRSYPWKDAVSAGLKGLSVEEFDVTSPRAFGRAMKAIVERAARIRPNPGS